jgi:hypothetical protein
MESNAVLTQVATSYEMVKKPAVEKVKKNQNIVDEMVQEYLREKKKKEKKRPKKT